MPSLCSAGEALDLFVVCHCCLGDFACLFVFCFILISQKHNRIVNIKWRLFKANKTILSRTLVVEEKPRRTALPQRSKRYIKGPKKNIPKKQNIWSPKYQIAPQQMQHKKPRMPAIPGTRGRPMTTKFLLSQLFDKHQRTLDLLTVYSNYNKSQPKERQEKK